MRWLQSKRAALASLILIWVLARIYAAHMAEPFMDVEVQQAKKLLEYGFSARHGASLWTGECTGVLPNPEAFNYTHHPYPFFWLLTALLSVVGPYGVLAFTTLLKLAGYILTFKIFDVRFGRTAAWLATLFYGLSPCGLLEDLNYSCVTQSALLWPVGVWFLMGRNRSTGAFRNLSPWGCGILAFLAGQVDWLALVVVPGLVVLVHDWEEPWRTTIRSLLRNPRAWALIVGGGLSALVFLVQVFIYHPDLHNLSDWLAAKSGTSAGTVSKARMFALVALRMAIFVGPVLVLGAVLGIGKRTVRRDPLLLGCLVFLVCYALLIGVIPNYFYMERTVFVTLLFPFAALTAAALPRLGKGMIRALAICCLPGVIFAHFYLSLPAYSLVAKQLADLIARHSEKQEIVLTNLKPLQPPYGPSDIPGGKATAILADRRIHFGIEKLGQFEELPRLLKRSRASLVFFRLKPRPMEDDLSALLQQKALKQEEVALSLPASTPTLTEKVRGWVWYKIMRRSPPPEVQSTADGPLIIQIYHLELSAKPSP